MGIHARHNPTNDKTVSDDLQNASSNIVALPRYRLTKLGEQMAHLPYRPENRTHFVGGEETRLHGGNIGDRVRAVDSRPARAAAGGARCRRQGARAFYRQAVRFPCLSEYLGQLPARARQGFVQQAAGAMVPPIFPVAPADARVARAAPPACSNRN